METLPEDDVVGIDDTFGVIADIISRGIDTNNDGVIDQLPIEGELLPTPSSSLFSTDDDFLGGIDEGVDDSALLYTDEPVPSPAGVLCLTLMMFHMEMMAVIWVVVFTTHHLL